MSEVSWEVYLPLGPLRAAVGSCLEDATARL
jgi:hypothetical protein